MNDTFTLSQGQGHKLEKAVIRNNGTTTDMEWLCTGSNFNNVLLLARGEAVLTLKEKPAPKEEPPLDTIIRVNRSICPVYPDWMKEVMHPELEAVGPNEYDLSKVELYLHDKQKDSGRIVGNYLYEHLKETDLLKTCLGLHDAVEIQKKGIAAFRKLFGNKAVFCWKSVVRDRDDDLGVPYVYGDGGEVVVRWNWLVDDWRDRNPAACFAS